MGPDIVADQEDCALKIESPRGLNAFFDFNFLIWHTVTILNH